MSLILYFINSLYASPAMLVYHQMGCSGLLSPSPGWAPFAVWLEGGHSFCSSAVCSTVRRVWVGRGLVTVTWAEVLSQGVAVRVTTCNVTREDLVTVMKLSRLQQWMLTYTDRDRDTGCNKDLWRDAAIYAEALSNINQEWFSRVRWKWIP